jgi:O-antigen/teichoic acid export membrane protein
MSDNLANKRIAKNTIYMYIRLFTTMVLGLYISRVVLLVLGVSDFGLFSVVGGVLAMFTFISGSLSSATARFLNIEMGRSNGNLNRIFNINLLLHIFFALIILVLAETIGLWYVYNKLNVAPDKIGDAIFVYQVSILTACLGIINIPYASLFGAFERFKFLAKFDIINTVIRLIFVILLQYYEGNSLRFYCIIMGLTTVNAFIVYHWFAAKNWPSIIKLKLVSGWKNYKEVLVFSNWNLFAAMALMARYTGSDLILNLFFGTAINGAFAVSKTVNNYITTFSTNFDSASGPQIIQSYSAGDLQRCNYLVNKLGRVCILLFQLVFFPLYIELDFVLHLWLIDVPDGVLIFCQLNLILAAVALTGGGLVQLINASGKIKWFKISGSAFFLLSIPATYLLFQIGAPAYSIIILFTVADIMNRIVQLILMKTIIGFDSWGYIKDAYFNPAIIALIMSFLLWAYSLYPIDNSYYQFMSIVVCFLIIAFLIYTIGLTSGERTKLVSFVKNKIRI